MKDDDFERLLDDRKRLVRLIIVFSSLWFLSLIGLAIYGTIQLRDVKSIALNQKPSIVTINKLGTPGIKGQDGLTVMGATGSVGLQGVAGVGMQGPMGLQGNVGPQGPAGPVGPQGETGAPGKTAFSRSNPETGVQECRYSGDIAWQPIEECQ